MKISSAFFCLELLSSEIKPAAEGAEFDIKIVIELPPSKITTAISMSKASSQVGQCEIKPALKESYIMLKLVMPTKGNAVTALGMKGYFSSAGGLIDEVTQQTAVVLRHRRCEYNEDDSLRMERYTVEPQNSSCYMQTRHLTTEELERVMKAGEAALRCTLCTLQKAANQPATVSAP